MNYCKEMSAMGTHQSLMADILSGNTLLADHGSAASLDPLGADERMAALPAINAVGDLPALIGMWQALIDQAPDLATLTCSEAIAALRDLGFIASSVRRIGVEPMHHLPHFERIFSALAEVAKTVARDTSFTYIAANPTGNRLRSFTLLHEERLFIEAIRYGLARTEACIKKLYAAKNFELSESRFACVINNAADDLQQLIDAMVEVKLKIPATIFTHEIRPFFDPYQVGAKTLVAPGGAQMSLLLIDQLLWGSDGDEAWYPTYWHENIQYSPSALKEFSQRLQGTPSLMTKVQAYRGAVDRQVSAALNALETVFNKLLAFRLPHIAVAKANFALRNEQDVGSGGYQPDMLKLLIEATRKRKIQIKKIRETQQK